MNVLHRNKNKKKEARKQVMKNKARKGVHDLDDRK